jgi:hypothetical protein
VALSPSLTGIVALQQKGLAPRRRSHYFRLVAVQQNAGPGQNGYGLQQ